MPSFGSGALFFAAMLLGAKGIVQDRSKQKDDSVGPAFIGRVGLVEDGRVSEALQPDFQRLLPCQAYVDVLPKGHPASRLAESAVGGEGADRVENLARAKKVAAQVVIYRWSDCLDAANTQVDTDLATILRAVASTPPPQASFHPSVQMDRPYF